jgi:pilus assembly protein CpaE
LALNLLPAGDWIDPSLLTDAAAAVVQVDAGSPASIKRFEQLARETSVPLIAAAFDPPLALVRSLVRAGAHDVIPLPMTRDELETSLAPMRAEIARVQHDAAPTHAKLVSVIKGVGGCGATALASQLALRFAAREAAAGREACLMDLDVQFGTVAFQLGMQPKLTLLDLIEAGPRMDGALLRATTAQHSSGLYVIAAPPEMMPLESLSSEQLMHAVELATREFGTVFVDLPANWTNWSLSLVARSDIVLLVTELTVAGINGAKRQLNLLRSQDLAALDVRVVINRFDKALARTVRLSDAREALGRDVAFTVANDFPLMRSAIDRGVAVDEVRRKSPIGKDLDALDAALAATLGLER